jgi:hypothetical protein
LYKLSVTTPDPKLVQQYLKTIANAFDVPIEEGEMVPERPSSETIISPPPPTQKLSFSTPQTKPPPPDSLQLPSAPQGPIVDKEPDFDHLSKRFEILKKK